MGAEDYPLTLYREGGQFIWDGRPTDARTVNDEDEHLAAIDEGWRETAAYLAGEAAPERDAWDEMTDEELRAAASKADLNLHHKTGRAKLLQALRENGQCP